MLRPYSLAQVRFELADEIGAEGKNSRVFVAYDPQLDARIVIKKVSKERMASVDEYFVESSLLYAGAHTNVLPILYACQDDEHVYLAMPYLRRGSLKAMLAAQSLSLREVITLSVQFLSGLHHIHSKRLIHFDIKPDNILISDRGEAVLSDFGLAKQMELSGRAGQDRIYSKMSPPEAFDNEEFTTRFDIYQAGLTLYRMCVGDGEFYRQFNTFVVNGALDRDLFRHAVRNEQFPNRGAFREHIPVGLRNTIRRSIKSDPAERFASALELANELAGLDGPLLDWRYKEAADAREWTKITEERCYRLRVTVDGACTATKRIGDGQEKRVNDFCGQIASRDIRRFLGEHE
jgi:eukaryotic-like serine/threonine-protein kinase